MNRKHMKSTTTKKIEINTPRKFMLIYFWSNFDPRKTHKGESSERGAFIIFRALTKNFLQQSFSTINTQTYLDLCTDTGSKCVLNISLIYVQRNQCCVQLSLHLLLYGCLKNHACLLSLFSKNLWQLGTSISVPNSPRNTCS